MQYFMFDPKRNKYFSGYESYPADDESDYVSTRLGFCDHVIEAMRFPSEQEALYYLYKEYGMDYTQSTFCVVAIPEKLYTRIEKTYIEERERCA